MTGGPDRQGRLLAKTREKARAEESRLLSRLKERPDYWPDLDFFLELLSQRDLRTIEERCGRKAVRLLCNQAPLELFWAAGFQPVKIISGSLAAAGYSAANWPALMCPLIKGILTELELDPDLLDGPWVIPTTCDWVVKFWEMRGQISSRGAEVFWLELPHLKNQPKSQKRWLEEVWDLKKFLENLNGRKIGRRELRAASLLVCRLWDGILELKKARLDGKLPSIWFVAVMNSFFLGDPEKWLEAVRKLLAGLPAGARPAGPRVFLAGSPVFFPNYKLPLLMEQAGLWTAADDLCSSERIFPFAQRPAETSEYDLLASLAGRYHQGCLCPTFGDNERRINNILSQREECALAGTVFGVLKGCHPYDLESTGLEAALKEKGLRFLRLETDYSLEDSQNLLTRLEAFGQSLKGAD
ncbi:MAG: 2-hydroxyacyl-CoA dehydratase family protein [Deltaproteobacteria bacterium]|jgi:benzoyl-CoA reductase/2-hydroxyglutaryl-CoA dehydratase subunit BcrC/BadD/HgdB|nr:2-hydroxyacyl-CoA dehydratase family protein [Deltaproteobacteria bacterium]